MSVPESMLEAEKAAEEAIRQAYTPEGTPPESHPDDGEPQNQPAESHGDSEWEHKYNVLRGKYDAELPRALDEARYWRDRCEQMQAQLNAVAAARQPEPEPDIVDQELVDYLGEDAAKILAKRLAQQKKEIEAQFGQVANLSRQSAEQAFWAQVRQAFPNYADMQNDPALNRWLSDAWPGSRSPRLEQAKELARTLDAEGFIGLLRAYSPDQQQQPARPAMPGPTPRRAAGSGTPPPAKQTHSPADIERFGSRIMNLKSQGRYQEAANLEKEFDAIVRENRIGV